MASRHKVYTGIGSRETPLPVMAQMVAIAVLLRERRWTLRSGGADGADEAFAAGAEPHMNIYLPWKGFNGHPHAAPFQWKYDKKWQAELIAKDIHPAWDKCDHSARKLHTRNVFQVLGPNLDEPSGFVICWTKDGKEKGGTRTALVLAARNNIPVFNLYDLAYSGMEALSIVETALKADQIMHPATT